MAADFRKEESGDKERQHAETTHGEEGNIHPQMFRHHAAQQRANTETAEKGGVSVTHPFPLLALGGNIADIGLGNG